MTNQDTLAGGVKNARDEIVTRILDLAVVGKVLFDMTDVESDAFCDGLRDIVTNALAALPATGAVPDFDAALKAFIKSVREQDSEWTDDIDEGEVLLTSPSGDYFAPYYPLLAALSAASPPKPSEAMVEARSVQAALHMLKLIGEEVERHLPDARDAVAKNNIGYYAKTATDALTAALSGGAK